MWYGLEVGLTLSETLDIRLCELKNLIAIEQIKTEGARLKRDDDEEFFELLKYR